MIRTASCLAFLMLVASPLSAQSTFYGGGIVAAEAGRPGSFDLGTFPAAGGFIGWRFHDAWSIELHFDRGFGESAERAEIEIFGHSIVQDRAGQGRALLLAWKSRHRSRVGAAVTMGIATRSFSTHRLSFTKDASFDSYPVHDEARVDGGGGWSGGVLFPIALGGRWSLAPELRVTLGVTGESGGYAQFYPGVRMMWGF